MAGLAAALVASAAGVHVSLVERGSELGGSMRYSGGFLSGWERFDDVRSNVPDGDPELQRILFDDQPADFRWLESLGVGLDEPETFAMRVGRAMDRDAFIAVAAQRLRTDLRLGTRLVDLQPSGDHWIAVLDGAPSIHVRSVVLASGGFQNSAEMVHDVLGLHLDRLWERNSGLSDGTAIRIGLALGGSLVGDRYGFYGHNLPAPPARFSKEQLFAVSQQYGPWAVALDLRGKRFTDESVSDLGETIAQDAARLPEGRCFYVFDQAIYREHVAAVVPPAYGRNGGRRPFDRLAETMKSGAVVLEAESLAELSGRMNEYGVPAQTALETLGEFSTAAGAGRAAELPVPRRRHARRLDEPPYYAVLVQPGITMTWAGLRVGHHGQVLREDDSEVPGVFAAGADVGNISNRIAAGGLSLGLTFGRRAGAAAAAHARGRKP
jgi:hypothetical protein